jgi:hypothetical protein
MDRTQQTLLSVLLLLPVNATTAEVNQEHSPTSLLLSLSLGTHRSRVYTFPFPKASSLFSACLLVLKAPFAALCIFFCFFQ